jgi:hypothetical protein
MKILPAIQQARREVPAPKKYHLGGRCMSAENAPLPNNLIGGWNLGATARFLGFGGVSSACPL